MKPKTMVLMVVAVGCGLVASYMTSRLIADRGNTPPEVPKGTFLVAKKKLPALTALTKPKELFVEKELPLDSMPKKAITEWKDLEGKRVNKIINEEMWVTADDLVSKDMDGIAAQLPPGSRAIGLRVNPESLVGGFILPNSRVDVVCTLPDGEATIILQNMLVLAVGLVGERDPEKGKTMLADTVTLAARPEESQRIRSAARAGDLSLLLRPLGETTNVNIRGTKSSDLKKPLGEGGPNGPENAPVESSATVKVPTDLPPVPETPPAAPAAPMVEAPPPAAPVEEPPPPKTHTLKVINGENTQTHVYVADGKGGWKNGAAIRSEPDEPKEPKQPKQPNKVAPKPPVEKPRLETSAPKPLTTQELLLKNSGLPPVRSTLNQ